MIKAILIAMTATPTAMGNEESKGETIPKCPICGGDHEVVLKKNKRGLYYTHCYRFGSGMNYNTPEAGKYIDDFLDKLAKAVPKEAPVKPEPAPAPAAPAVPAPEPVKKPTAKKAVHPDDLELED